MSPVLDAEFRIVNDPATLTEHGTVPRSFVSILALLLVCTGIWVYRNSLDGASVFDDDFNMEIAAEMFKKPSLKSLVPKPRTFVFLSFALNRKIGGFRVRGYHQVNRLIHILATLTLFAIVRRTLRLRPLQSRFGGDAPEWLALSIAMIWLVHPLQTQAVTYTVQRIESSMGLVYLLCVYSLIRGATATRSWPWHVLGVFLFFIGIGTKEVIATAPVFMLMFDRIFLADSWRYLLRRCAWFYAVLLLPIVLFWIYMLPYLNMKKTHDIGLGHPYITPWMYGRTQSAVILHYLRLAFWPDKLCLDYCWPVMPVRELIVPLTTMAMLLVVTLWALRYRPRIGFLAAGFFLILAPTSSVMPINDLAVEHRMYLPLACVVTLTLLAIYELCNWLAARAGWARGSAARLLAVAAAVVAIPLAARTISRNEDYRSVQTIWRTCVDAFPKSHRAHHNLAVTLWQTGRKTEARDHFRRAFDLSCVEWGFQDEIADEYESLKITLRNMGQSQDIFRILREGVGQHPEIVYYHWFLGNESLRTGDYATAVAEFREVIRINPKFHQTQSTLATALFLGGRPHEAIAQLRIAVRLNPKNISMLEYLVWVLSTHPDPEIRDGRDAVRLLEDMCMAGKAKDANSWGTLAAAYAECDRFDEAVEAARRSVELSQKSQQRGGAASSQADRLLFRKGSPIGSTSWIWRSDQTKHREITATRRDRRTLHMRTLLASLRFDNHAAAQLPRDPRRSQTRRGPEN